MKLKQVGEAIVKYRQEKGLESATDLGETVKGLRRQADALEAAIASGQKPDQRKALIDALVWGIGGCEVAGVEEAWDGVEARVAENARADRVFSSVAAKS